MNNNYYPWNHHITEEKFSDEELQKKMADLEERIGKVGASDFPNHQYLHQLTAAKQQLIDEYYRRQDIADAPPELEIVNVGGDDDTGLTKKQEQEKEKRVAKKRKRRRSRWGD